MYYEKRIHIQNKMIIDVKISKQIVISEYQEMQNLFLGLSSLPNSTLGFSFYSYFLNARLIKLFWIV